MDPAKDTLWFFIRLICFIAIGFGVLSCISPFYNVWSETYRGRAELARAESNRQIAVLEAQAKMDSAKMLAAAEVERAKGVAEANQIIGDSLKGNEQYLRYLWIDSLHHSEGKDIIYVPTEAGLPILEAGRLKDK